MIKGKIFSIEEFSVFNGDGLRTTVFLKGCPLKCVWCHSPEGQSFKTEYLRSPNGCVFCEKCLDAGEKETGKRQLSEKSVYACPKNLVRKCGVDYDAETLCKTLLKKSDYFKETGGGVTFSGGEPTAQPEFLLTCLKYLKGKLNRCLQTSGFCPPEIFKSVIAECDAVLFDIKLMDSVLHKKYIGADNSVILENFSAAVKSGIKVVPRTPLIPTITDTADNVEKICRFLNSNGVSYLEILKYNKMAGSKYKLSGKVFNPPYDESIPCLIHSDIYEKFGITVKIV